MLKNLDEIKKEMIAEAKEKYGVITPCGGHKDLMSCFTYDLPGKILLWFNSPDKSTRAIERIIDNEL